MKELILRSLAALGLDLRITRTALSEIPYFLRTLKAYRKTFSSPGLSFRMRDLFPVLTDRLDTAGTGSGHYFHQDLWAARKIYAASPRQHIDVGSRIDGFIAHLLTFMPVTQIDIRPLTSTVDGLQFVKDDATLMSSFPDNSISSLSSLHVIEHFGLGRYGDPVDPEAWRRALRSFSRVLAPNGRLYLSVPVGRERLEFNAHRVLAPESVMEECAGLELVSFSAVRDDGAMISGIQPADVRQEAFACGMFEWTKSGR